MTVAILGVVFIVLSALVVDMGYWYNVKRQLQSAADAAALAGCRELAVNASNSEIWGTVTAYAEENAVVPVDGISVVAPSAGGQSDIGDDFVKVTVTSDAVGFFARALGYETNRIAAQSKAKLAYLTGAKNPMPWGLPILNVDRLVASVNGGEYELTPGVDNYWGGWLPSGSSGPVDVIAYNDQTLDPAYPDGVPEEIGPVANLIHLPAESRFVDVRMPKQTFTSGAGETVRVQVELAGPLAPGESVQVTFGKKDHTADLVGVNTYEASFAAPTTDDLWSTYVAQVAIVMGKTLVEALPGNLIFVCRRSTYPIKMIEVSPIVQPAGSTQPVQVTVEVNDYEIGRVYELKVIGGGGETGNFMALDFHTLRHSPNWRHPQDPAEYPDMPSATGFYYDLVAGTAEFDFIAHVNDTVWTQPGNMSGPSTIDALETRIGSEPSDYAAWVAADMPPSNRVVYIPVTEKVQEVTGQTPLRIVSFASFYIESYTKDALIRGRFIDYVSPAWIVSPTPPNPRFVVVAPHLVAEGVDF
ncbi:MAG: pilus assembly protein TadG-related protein [Coriobacteriia bacterium]